MAMTNLPPNVSPGDRHFWEDGCVDHCPNCERPVNDEPFCPYCDFVLDEDEAAAIEAGE